MRLISTLLFINITFASSINSQTTIEPNTLFIGVDSISQVSEDTLLYWTKKTGALRGGFYNSGEITTSNTGDHSLAYGTENIAKGANSIALGAENIAERYASIALGRLNEASGAESISIGTNNQTLGSGSTAIGSDLVVQNENTVVVGLSNANIPVIDNRFLRPIFVVGNGDKSTGGSNAVTVIRDGRTGINTEAPLTDLHLVHKNFSDFAGFRIENKDDNPNGNKNWWRFYTRSMDNELALYNNNFMGGTSAVGEFNTSGSYSGPSDRRLKKDIVELPYGLADVLKLSPKRYQFKHVADRLDIGLIAQDVMEVIPELVSYDEKEDKYMMNYDGFGVLAIKAIQELSEIIEKQQVLIEELIEQNKN